MRSGITLRVARPTDQLESVVRFYRDGLGLEELGAFRDHDGFDGVMLGVRGEPYHLEFTCQPGDRRNGRRHRSTCWCAICLTARSGSNRSRGCGRTAATRWRLTTRIGIVGDSRSRIRTGIAWCCRTRRGRMGRRLRPSAREGCDGPCERPSHGAGLERPDGLSASRPPGRSLGRIRATRARDSGAADVPRRPSSWWVRRSSRRRGRRSGAMTRPPQSGPAP